MAFPRHTVPWLALGFALTLCLDAAAQDRRFGFPLAQPYDSIATIGRAGEANPLFIYRALSRVQLVDSTTVLYSDRAGGRVVMVDMAAGVGWEIDDRGAEGPGEFGGGTPWFGESGGTVYLAAQNGQGSKRSMHGELLETWTYAEQFWGVWGHPVGIVRSGVVVTHYRETPGFGVSDPQSLAQGIRAYSEDGLLWSYELPSLTWIPTGSESSRADGPGVGITVHARHETIAVIQSPRRWVKVLNVDGSERGEIALDHDAFTVFVDAQERIWIQVWTRNEKRTGSYVVLDRNMNFLMNVTERSVFDAWRDYILTISGDDEGMELLHLLRRE